MASFVLYFRLVKCIVCVYMFGFIYVIGQYTPAFTIVSSV